MSKHKRTISEDQYFTIEDFKIRNDFEDYKLTDTVGENSIRITTFNDISFMKEQMNDMLNDEHYSTGTYKSEDKHKWIQ